MKSIEQEVKEMLETVANVRKEAEAEGKTGVELEKAIQDKIANLKL